MADDGDRSKINVVVKTSNAKETIEIEPNATIKEFKVIISTRFIAPVAQLCLIFAGRILKDADTLESYSIKDGLTVHLVIKSENKAQQQAANHASQTSNPETAPSPTPSQPSGQQPSQPSTTPEFNPFGFGLGGLGGDPGNFQQTTQQLQQQMLTNPDLMRQIMDNPVVQGMMSNPDLMRQLILGNPQMQQLIERNPEISHILNNPELMRQTMEMARNPALMQEMMRNQDRALSNLESLPGGFNALQRMFTDIQEPMMNAAQEQMQQMQSNPFAALFGQQGATTGSTTSTTTTNSTSNPQRGTENLSPLPNPWAPTGAQQSTAPSTPLPSATPSTASQMAGTSPITPSTGTNPPTTNPLLSGMSQTAPMQSMMEQFSSNPQMMGQLMQSPHMQQMMQSPHMQQMMQQMMQNPDLMSTIMRTNPMFQGNPQLAEQVSSQLPQFMAQMQNPELQQAMTNPRTLQALMQIQQGMQQLQTEAPGLLSGSGFPGGVGTFPPVPPSTTQTTTATGTTATTTNTTTGTTASTDRPNPPLAGTAQDSMSQIMSQMMSAMSQNQQNPETRFQTQLEQLAAMGFVDRQRNIQVLTLTGGDVNAAIERLLQ